MKLILQARTIQLYPNKTQLRQMRQTFGSVRFLWNQMLDMQQTRYQHEPTSVFVSAYGMNYLMPCLKKEYPWLKDIDSTALQLTNETLAKSYQQFFQKKANYPKFKKKRYEQSYTSKNVSNSIRLLDRHHIQIPKLGVVYYRSGSLPNGKIKRITIRQKSNGKVIASILLEREIQQLPKTNKSIGADLGLKNLLILSDGTKIPTIRFDKELEERLIYWQRRASRRLLLAKERMKHDPTLRLEDCKNYQKARRMVAVYHDKIKSRRYNYLQKLSTELVQEYDTIVFEDLKTKNLMHNHKLARAIANAGWNMLLNMVKYKCEWHDKTFIQVNPAYTSQTCSHCGSVNGRLGYDRYGWLKVRNWTCPDCGSQHDRDVNAAQNILALGLA